MSALPYLDLAAPGFSTRGPEVIAARAAAPFARTPFGLAVLCHREAGMILRDRRFRQGSHAWPDTVGLTGPFAAFWKRSVIGQEGARHKALRRVAQDALDPDWIAGLETDFASVATRLLSLLGREFEAVSELTGPFSGQVIARLLGLTPDHAPSIAADATALGLAMNIDAKSHEPVFDAACGRLTALARTLLDNPPPDSLPARLSGAGLSRQELVDLLVISIFGGVDTTRAQLAFALALFARHPEQWTWLRNHPEAISQAIDEVIRAWPTTTWSTREAVEEVEMSGVIIPRGTTLHVLSHATATDPAVHAPAGFDVTARRKPHFGFGGGAHHCLGQLVARRDMACALRVMLIRWERVEISGEPEWQADSGNTAPLRLPLRVTNSS